MSAVDLCEKFLQEHETIFAQLTAFMLEYNAHTNLTRITTHDEIREKHYIDSLLPLTLCDVPRGTSMLDVGSGAGFPGIPMKLFRPDLFVTLLDSARKRTDYLEAVLREISLDCKVLTGRSEELAHNREYRERYGLVVARAVANTAALCEYCLPFVSVGGVFLAMKGKQPFDSSKVVELLGGEIEAVHEYELPSGDGRSLVVIRKVKETPSGYPRRRVNIVKNPIQAKRTASNSC